MKDINNFEELFVHQLRDLLSVENQTKHLMPKMADISEDRELKEIFEKHAEETRKHHAKVKECLEMLQAPTSPEICHAMVGLITEADELIDSIRDPKVRDAALVTMAQRMHHYEIAGYGTAVAHAKVLGHKDIARKLEQILEDEGKMDKKLSKMAEKKLNSRALAAR